jgi:integrase
LLLLFIIKVVLRLGPGFLGPLAPILWIFQKVCYRSAAPLLYVSRGRPDSTQKRHLKFCSNGRHHYLIVGGPTSKNWSYRYWFKGTERWHGLGSFKDVSLKNPRLARDAARLQVRAGVDLVQEKRDAREEKKAAETIEKAKNFEQCAQIYIDERWSGWSKKHRAQWPSSLKRYAYPTIGHLTIAEIKPSHLHEVLSPIWIEKRETANRVRGRVETIIANNMDVDDTNFRNPAELTKQLREKLPRRPKRAVEHHPALPYSEMPQFMATLSSAGGRAAAMLRYLIFTACRTNEVVAANWREIERSTSGWKIPGERMKMDQDHTVPLSDPALAVLDEMISGHADLIFRNPDGGEFSENAMLAVLDRLG